MSLSRIQFKWCYKWLFVSLVIDWSCCCHRSDMWSPGISYFLFASTYCACFSCVFVLFLSFPFHSDLDRPVFWGSSGLLLFSCSSRYLISLCCCFHLFISLNHFSWPVNTESAAMREGSNPTCTHTFAFRDNTIAVRTHLGTPTVDPFAHSTIGKAPESIRSQLLCNWVRY